MIDLNQFSITKEIRRRGKSLANEWKENSGLLFIRFFICNSLAVMRSALWLSVLSFITLLIGVVSTLI